MSTHDPSMIIAFAHGHPQLALTGLAIAAVGVFVWVLEEKAKREHVTARDLLSAAAAFPAAAVAAGLLFAPALMYRVVWIAAAVLAAVSVLLLVLTVRRRRSSRVHYRPLHDAVGAAAGHDGDSPRKYLKVSRDLSQTTVRMTPAAAADASRVKRLVHAVPQVLQLGEHVVVQELHGNHPRLVFRACGPKESLPVLPIRDMIPRLARVAGPKQIALGVEAEAGLIEVDFARVVHMLISAMTGSGKSNLTTFILMQFLFKGAVGVVIDPTGMSYPWAKDLPNVFYARDDGDVRRACHWLDGELKRRDAFVRDHSDLSGFVEGGFGTDLIVVADEKNLMERRLNQTWALNGGKGCDPALLILNDVHYAGRKVGIHALVPMVRGDAKAAGGGTVRGQAGLVAFGANPKQAEWDMFFRGDPKPECREIPVPAGRMQVCFGGAVHEIQVPHCLEVPKTGAERIAALEMATTVRDYALSGTVTPAPAELLDGEEEYVQFGAELEERDEPTPHTQVSLSDVIAEELTGLDLRQLQNVAARGKFPEVAGKRGRAYLYDREQIIAWERERTGQPEQAAGAGQVADVIPINRKRENA